MTTTTDERFLDIRQVREKVPVTPPTIHSWMKAGKFPRAREVGPRSFWVASEVDAWMKDRPIRRYKSDYQK
jgi:predicted DNA-binding transcriptional regulator AlpA